MSSISQFPPLKMSDKLDPFSISQALSPTSIPPSRTDGDDPGLKSSCHGFWYNSTLVIPSALFVIYLGFNAKKNLKKLRNGRSFVMIAYYVLLWSSVLLNFAWCSFQCTPGKEVYWNLLSLFTESGMLCLEISVLAFLLQENYVSGLETLAKTFIVSGVIVGMDILLKAIFIFGFGVPLFVDSETTHKAKWGLWTMHELLFVGVYAYILFVHYSKWRDKLPPRPTFYNYVVIMFVVSLVALFSCGLAGSGAGLGLWLHSIMIIGYHSLYLPLLYATFLADFFQEEDLLLDNAYYSEMRDAGFFDSDWE